MTDLLELAVRAASFEMMLNVLNWWLDENGHGNLRILREGERGFVAKTSHYEVGDEMFPTIADALRYVLERLADSKKQAR